MVAGVDMEHQPVGQHSHHSQPPGNTVTSVKSAAFPATEYNEVFLGYKLG
jgi:hypothetical protein